MTKSYKKLAIEGKFIELFFDYSSNQDYLRSIINLNIFEIINSYSPKTTKILHTSYFKEVCSCEDVRLLTLVSHLYIENFLNEIINRRIPNPNKILDYRFKQKLDIIHSLNHLSLDLYDDINFLNKLRNSFAHDLKFNISKFDFEKSLSLKKYYKLNPYKKKSYQNLFLVTLYKLFLFELGFKLGKNFKELYLLNK